MTIKNKYPLFLISELVTKLQGTYYFTKLDVYWRFNNVCVESGDKWKVAFHTNHRLFKPFVMFFYIRRCSLPRIKGR